MKNSNEPQPANSIWQRINLWLTNVANAFDHDGHEYALAPLNQLADANRALQRRIVILEQRESVKIDQR